MKRLVLMVLIISPIITSGCWDMQEINERIFPYSVGFDLIGEEDFEKGRYDITFTYLNINALGNQAIQEDLVYLTKVRGNTLFEGAANIADRLQKPMYLRDLKVLIMPESLGQNKALVKEIIDGLNRDYMVNQAINLLVVKTTAGEILEEKIKSDKQMEIEGLFYGLLRNDRGSGKFIPSSLHSFINEMYASGATLVPVARIKNGDIVLDASGVFKDYELKGYLDQEDTRNVALMTNQIKEMGINTVYQGADFALRTASPKTKKNLTWEGDRLKISFLVKINGEIEQYIMGRGDQLGRENQLEKIEEALGQSLKESLDKTISTLQEDLGADVIGVSDFLYKFYPKIWSEMEGGFSKAFPDLEIEVDVDVKIKRRGLTK